MIASGARKTVGEALKWAARSLGGSDEAYLEADILLMAAAGARREALYARNESALSGECQAKFEAAVRERAESGCPVAYLTGTKEFAGLQLAMRRGVFIPRPETEGLFELVADWWKSNREARKSGVIVDPCSGSGALGVALAYHLRARVICIDIDPAAAALTGSNAKLCGVGDLVEAREGNFLEALERDGPPILAVAANPPYVATQELRGLSRDIADFEPRAALDGGPDGLAAIRQLARGAGRALAPGGLLALEIGADQEAAVRGILGASEWEGVSVKTDLAGRVRYAAAVRNGLPDA